MDKAGVSISNQISQMTADERLTEVSRERAHTNQTSATSIQVVHVFVESSYPLPFYIEN